jgi:hypothetical protein
MASPPNLVQISFAGGIDESMTDEVLDPSTAFRVLENTRQDYQGGANKRLGFGSKTRNRFSGSRTSGARLTAYRGAPVIIDASATLDVYDENYALSTSIGTIPECASDAITLPRAKDDSQVFDVAIVNGVVVTSYKYWGYVSVANAATGVPVSPTVSLLGSGATDTIRTYLATFSSRYVAAFTLDANTTDLQVNIYDTTARTWGSAVVVEAASGTQVNMVSVASVSDRAIIAYAAGTDIKLKTYNQSGLILSQTVAVGAGTTHVAIDVVGTTAWLAAVQGAATNAGSFSTSTLASIAAYGSIGITPTVACARLDIASKTDTTKARVYMFDTTTTNGTELVFADVKTVASAAALDGSTVTVHNVAPSSRMFRQGTRFYMAVHGSPVTTTFFASNAQRVLHVVDCTENSTHLRPVAHVEPGLHAVVEGQSHWAFDASGRACFAYGVLTRGALAAQLDIVDSTAIKLLRLDFSSFLRFQNTEHDGALFFGGACTYAFDGEVAAEAGFLVAPPPPTLTASGGGFIPAGTYSYVVIYEYVGSDGRVVYSGVSTPTSINFVGASDVTVKIAPLTVTARTGLGLRAVPYRTTIGGSAPYYRLDAVQNNTSTGLLSYVDQTTDATLAARPKLYAPNLPQVDGDKLDRRAPPGMSAIVSYNGFLCGASGQSVLGSGQSVYGEATWFSPVFETPIPDGGAIAALATQDGTLYVFKRTSIFALNGEPPSDNASAGGLGAPRRLSSDLGCINPRSVVTTSIGIFFQSDRGIEILDRSGNVSYIGQKIQRTLASFPIVSSAVVDTRNSLVRFSLAASETDGIVDVGGRDVVYDLQLGVWTSVDRKKGQSADEASQDACVVLDGDVWRYAWLGRDGFLYTERLASDSNAHLDGSTWITRAAETGSFKTGGIQGQQAVSWVQLLERKTTDHDSAIALAYNYDSAFQTATTWQSPAINTVLSGGWPITQLRHQPHDDSQPCQGIRARVTDATPTSGAVGSGAASTWIALSLDITPKPGLFEVPEELT